MIFKDLKIFSQNVQKNDLVVNTILKTQFHFNIIFIQEPPWSTFGFISSSKCGEDEELVGMLNYLNWLTFVKSSTKNCDSLRVATFINIHLSSFQFSFHKDIFNHRDISLVSFFNNSVVFFLMNIYFDFSQSALKHLKDTEANIHNVLIMTGNFNIRDSL